MAFVGDYEDEEGLVLAIAFALQQSGKLKKKDRMDEPQMAVARQVVAQLKLSGYIVTPPERTKPPST